MHRTPPIVVFVAVFVWTMGWAGAGRAAPAAPAAPAAAAGQGPAPVGFFPAAGAADVCPDAPLRITFSGPPAIGADGKIRVFDASNDKPVDTVDVRSSTDTRTIGGLPNFKVYPVIVTGNEASVYLHDNALAYGKTYYVTVDPGVFKDEKGEYAGTGGSKDWRFTTRAAPPAKGATKLTVAADGSGDFCTVQGALDFVPAGNTTPTTILVRKGTYNEIIYFANKHALTIRGEDRKQSVIAYANNNKFNGANDHGAYRRGVFLAAGCNDLVITNLTVRNTTPRGGSQAEAVILGGGPKSRAILSGVDLFSYQDTLQINGQAYVNNCDIEGDVDFMWGNGPCFFEGCHCKGLRSKAYYTQIRNPATNHGYVYHRCTFDGPEDVKNMFLSRIDPKAFPYSEVVLLDCTLGDSVNPAGWLLNVKGAEPPDTSHVHFWEYNSHDAGGKPVDVSKRLPVSRQLTQPQDAKVIADYSTPSFVLGNDWEPKPPAGGETSP